MIAKGATFIVSENGKPLAEVIALAPDLAAKTPSQGITRHGPQKLAEIPSIDQASVMDRSSVCQLLGIASPEEADRACRVWPVASHLFTTDEAVAEWLKAPEVHFNGDTPLTKLRTEEGTEEVIALLWGLVYGNFQ